MTTDLRLPNFGVYSWEEDKAVPIQVVELINSMGKLIKDDGKLIFVEGRGGKSESHVLLLFKVLHATALKYKFGGEKLMMEWIGGNSRGNAVCYVLRKKMGYNNFEEIYDSFTKVMQESQLQELTRDDLGGKIKKQDMDSIIPLNEPRNWISRSLGEIEILR